MTYKALCQNCLRVVTFKTERGFDAAQCNEVSCICGGDLCGCAGCSEVVTQLEHGSLAPDGLKFSMESWTADGGAVGITERNFQLEAYRFDVATLAEPWRQVAGETIPMRAIAQRGGKSVVIEDIARSLGIKNVYVSKRTKAPENTGRLLLTRRKFESVQLGAGTVLEVLQVREGSIALGFEYGGGRAGSTNVQLGESLSVDTLQGPVLVSVVSIQGAQVRLAFEADRSINIVRTELL